MVTSLEVKRTLAHGTTKTAPNSEPTAMLVKRIPRCEELRWSALRPTAGRRAGMTEMSKENSRARISTTWIPRLYRTYRRAPTNDSSILSAGALDRLRGLCQLRIAKSTSRKPAALTAKTAFAPISGRSKPPRAGPMTPEIFICTPPRVTAEGSSSFVTASGITDVQNGALQAKPTPRRKTAISTTVGVRSPSEPSSARPAAAATSQICMTHKSFLRLTISASAPAGKVNRKKGREAAVERSERYKGDGVIVFMTHVAAMSWAETQHPETRLASQSLQKTGFRRANQMEVEFVLIGRIPKSIRAIQNSGVQELFC